jgi:hypothetical protein
MGDLGPEARIKETLDLAEAVFDLPRPRDAKTRCHAIDHGARPVEKISVAQEYARMTARVTFGIQHMAKPQQAPMGER